MGIKEKAKENWAFLISILIIAIITFLEFKGISINSILLGIILLLSILFAFIDKLIQDEDFDKFKQGVELKLSRLLNNKKNIEAVLNKQISSNSEWKNKKEISLNLLNRLMKKGLVDKEEENKPFNTTKIFALYCFPTTHIITKDKKIVHRMDKRIYPTFLKNLGFIRLHLRRGLFYVIPKERLIGELRNTFKLKMYILSKINEIIPQEWGLYLESVKKSRSTYVKSKYAELKKLNYFDVLKFNILLMNTDISENNIGYLNDKRAFNDEFNNFLKNEIDLTKINIQKNVKGKIIDFVKLISFELFFFEEKKKNLTKLLNKEQDIKRNLGINEWGDYLEKNNEDIAKEISKAGFSLEKSITYAQLLKSRIKEYEDALRELGINY